MDDDIELADGYCPMCSSPLYTRRCGAPGCDDGWMDMYESDPIWYDQGDADRCLDCGGRGRFVWCRECGFDATHLAMEEEGEL